MMKCSVCGNENLKVQGKSKLIQDGYYAVCSCGKVMIIQNGIAIPTPTDNNEFTKLLIQDATNALNNPNNLMAVSLNKDDIQTEMQPIQVKEKIANYISNFLRKNDNEEIDDEYEGYDDYNEYDEEYDEMFDLEEEYNHQEETRTSLYDNKDFSKKEYLLVIPRQEGHPTKEMFTYQNMDKHFMQDILNDIKYDFKLYELKEVEVKKEEIKVMKYML